MDSNYWLERNCQVAASFLSSNSSKDDELGYQFQNE